MTRTLTCPRPSTKRLGKRGKGMEMLVEQFSNSEPLFMHAKLTRCFLFW